MQLRGNLYAFGLYLDATKMKDATQMNLNESRCNKDATQMQLRCNS